MTDQKKIKTIIESWLRVRDQTVGYLKQKLALLKALPAAENKKDTQEFSQKN